MGKPKRAIQVEVEYTNTLEAERAVIDVLKWMLRELNKKPVDNRFDESRKTR